MIVEVAAVVMAAVVAVAVVSAAVDVPVGLLTDEPVNWNVQKQLLIELLTLLSPNRMYTS